MTVYAAFFVAEESMSLMCFSAKQYILSIIVYSWHDPIYNRLNIVSVSFSLKRCGGCSMSEHTLEKWQHSTAYS